MPLDQRLRSIEAKRARLLDVVAVMPPALFTAHPRPGKWSIQEIIEHLVLAEADVCGDLSELASRMPHRRSVRHRLLYLVVMFILRFDIPVRVPSRAMIPTGRRSLNDLRTQWEDNHRRLRGWIDGSAPQRLRCPLFVHPIAGPMTIAQALRMLEVHLDRHTRQVRALSGTGENADRAGPGIA